jgi:hypothetical protein
MTMTVNVFTCSYNHVTLTASVPEIPYPYNSECATCTADGRTGIFTMFRGRALLQMSPQ